MRFFIEYVKDFPSYTILNLTTGQLLSIPFFLLGLIVLYRT
jgi:prolipoprotein diacylglyceryltransferase